MLLLCDICAVFFFFFQAEDGIRDIGVTGVQTCALPIYPRPAGRYRRRRLGRQHARADDRGRRRRGRTGHGAGRRRGRRRGGGGRGPPRENGRASWRGRVEISVGGVSLKKKQQSQKSSTE